MCYLHILKLLLVSLDDSQVCSFGWGGVCAGALQQCEIVPFDRSMFLQLKIHEINNWFFLSSLGLTEDEIYQFLNIICRYSFRQYYFFFSLIFTRFRRIRITFEKELYKTGNYPLRVYFSKAK